jgi:NNP family nitrate/nitrite transporter-like MFS transporter
VVALALLGTGNGAVFQLVGLRFRREIGVVTGIVGAAGGFGGFFLPSALGALRDATGTYGSGLLAFALVCVGGAALMIAASIGWTVRVSAGVPSSDRG